MESIPMNELALQEIISLAIEKTVASIHNDSLLEWKNKKDRKMTSKLFFDNTMLYLKKYVADKFESGGVSRKFALDLPGINLEILGNDFREFNTEEMEKAANMGISNVMLHYMQMILDKPHFDHIVFSSFGKIFQKVNRLLVLKKTGWNKIICKFQYIKGILHFKLLEWSLTFTSSVLEFIVVLKQKMLFLFTAKKNQPGLASHKSKKINTT